MHAAFASTRFDEMLSIPCEGRAIDGAAIWNGLLEGRLRVKSAYLVGERAYLALRTIRDGAIAPSPNEARILLDVLSGQPQKVVAINLGIARSTASRGFREALHKLGVSTMPVPLALILAVQARSGAAGCDARSAVLNGDNGSCLYSVRRPEVGRLSALTATEQQIAAMVIDGHSRAEIAERRGTAFSTVAKQVHSVFSKLGLSGRFELIRRATEASAPAVG